MRTREIKCGVVGIPSSLGYSLSVSDVNGEEEEANLEVGFDVGLLLDSEVDLDSVMWCVTVNGDREEVYGSAGAKGEGYGDGRCCGGYAWAPGA